MEIGPQFRIHDKRYDLHPLVLVWSARTDVDALIRALSFDPGTRRGCLARGHRRRPGDRSCRRVRWRFVERQEGEQIGEVFFGQKRFDAFRHHREFAHPGELDIVLRHGFFAFAGHPENDALIALFGHQARQVATVLGHDCDGLITRANDEARIEHAHDDLVERTAAVAREVRANPAVRILPVGQKTSSLSDHLIHTGRSAQFRQ